jgi:uncharacterized protein (TIGR02757 family)
MTKQIFHIRNIKKFLDDRLSQLDKNLFINNDPVKIIHLFKKKEDIEISGFLTSIISWGNIKSIIKNAQLLMNIMDYSPYEFIINFNDNEINKIKKFYYRTLNYKELLIIIYKLKYFYTNKIGLSSLFYIKKNAINTINSLIRFCNIFLHNTENKLNKHIPSPVKQAACKRLNLFLRWMVRKDPYQIDVGIWNHISPANLLCPLDIHSGVNARKLGLINDKQNNMKAVLNLTCKLKTLDQKDPIKYDIVLFHLKL